MPYDTISANGTLATGQLTEDERMVRQAQMERLRAALANQGNRQGGGTDSIVWGQPRYSANGPTAAEVPDARNAMVEARQQQQAYDASTPAGMAAQRAQTDWELGGPQRGLEMDTAIAKQKLRNRALEEMQGALGFTDLPSVNGTVKMGDEYGSKQIMPTTPEGDAIAPIGPPNPNAFDNTTSNGEPNYSGIQNHMVRQGNFLTTTSLSPQNNAADQDRLALLSSIVNGGQFDPAAMAAQRQKLAQEAAANALNMKLAEANLQNKLEENATARAGRFAAAGQFGKANAMANEAGVPIAEPTAEQVISHNPAVDAQQVQLLQQAQQLGSIFNADPQKAAQIAQSMINTLHQGGLSIPSAKAYIIKLLNDRNLLPQEKGKLQRIAEAAGAQLINPFGAAASLLNPDQGANANPLKQVLGY